MNSPPLWHHQARKLRDEGVPNVVIAHRLRKSPQGVRWALQSDDERKKNRERERKRREAKDYTRTPQEKAPENHHGVMVEKHRAREIRQVYNRAAVMEIIAQRRGDIPTAELIRLLSL